MLRMLEKEAKAEWRTALVVGSIDPNVILALNIARPQTPSLELLLRIKEIFDIPVFLLRSKERGGLKVEEVVMGGADGARLNGNGNLAEPVQMLLERLKLIPGDFAPKRRVGDLSIDFINHRVTLRGKPVHLTPTEYELLAFLAQNPGQMVSHQTLSASIWGYSRPANDYNLRACIKKLRQKLGESRNGHQYIETAYGVGYRLADAQSLASPRGAQRTRIHRRLRRVSSAQGA